MNLFLWKEQEQCVPTHLPGVMWGCRTECLEEEVLGGEVGQSLEFPVRNGGEGPMRTPS